MQIISIFLTFIQIKIKRKDTDVKKLFNFRNERVALEIFFIFSCLTLKTQGVSIFLALNTGRYCRFFSIAKQYVNFIVFSAV